ncbi:hypothetical protein [Modestobacter sp. DSM 44400]|uniref:hypothetical protein n=1 Tax=Modestobacter sp. DSM 44400 TaxID=1550230 RepID=UPI0011151973|nr:hypothetical protein [Modestobacter sp. DSM 44400]
MVRRTQYWNLSVAHTVRTGATGHGESLTDLENYLLPQDRARGSGLFGWGVAHGLAVTATSGSPGVTVSPGVALDAAGRTIVLAPQGLAVVERSLDPLQIQDVPTVPVGSDGVPVVTTDLPSDCLLTITWREVAGENSLANAPALLHAPWLRLVTADGFVDGGDTVVLAAVTVDAAGGVGALTPGPRRSVGTPSGRLELSAPRAAGGPPLRVDQAPVAALTVTPEGDVVLSRLGEQEPEPLLTVGPGGDAELSGGLTVRGDARLDGDLSLGGALTVSGAGRFDGRVGIGLGNRPPSRLLQVEGNTEIHSGGVGAGFSFADRAATSLVSNPGNGERWIWYAKEGKARLWSGSDKLAVTPAGQVGIGHDHPDFLLDVNGRIRLRQASESSAGLWLFQTDAAADRAFVGMAGNDAVGLWGNVASDWGLTMDVGSLAVALKGDLWLPKTGGDAAILTHGTYFNEGQLTPNNLKLQMDSRGLIVGQRPFEFMIGYSFFRSGGGPFGHLGFRNDFVRLFGVDQEGHAFFAGGKGGYVTDYFVNAAGDTVEQGDVVVLQTGVPVACYGSYDGIPIPEVDLTDRPYDTRVCGIVADLVAGASLPGVDPRMHPPSEEGAEEGPDAPEHPLARYAGSTDDERTKSLEGNYISVIRRRWFAV